MKTDAQPNNFCGSGLEIKKHRAEIKDDSHDDSELSPTEKEFKKRFQAATHRMVHRKSSMHMYMRLQDNTFGKFYVETLSIRLHEVEISTIIISCCGKL